MTAPHSPRSADEHVVAMLLAARGLDPDVFCQETIRYWLTRGKTPRAVERLLIGRPDTDAGECSARG